MKKIIKKFFVATISIFIFLINKTYANMTIEAMEDVANRTAKMPQLFIYALFAMCFTIIIELLISRFMNFKHYKLVFFTNLITQLFLQTITLLLYLNPFIDLTFIIFIVEIIILIMEYKIYLNKEKDLQKNRVFLYTFVANFTTYIIPFIIGYYTERIV